MASLNALSLPLPLRKKYSTSSFLNLNNKYRSRLEIVALMLEAVKDNGAARFSIMKRAGINCTQLKKYLASLIEMGFIETGISEGRVYYRASERGALFLRQYYVLQGMLSDAYAKQPELQGAPYLFAQRFKPMQLR